MSQNTENTSPTTLGHYSSEQVSRLLEDILNRIPTIDPKLAGLRKFIKEKKEKIHQRI